MWSEASQEVLKVLEGIYPIAEQRLEVNKTVSLIGALAIQQRVALQDAMRCCERPEENFLSVRPTIPIKLSVARCK